MTALHVLGTPLLVTDYADLAAHCLAWARGQHCVALDFANTQIVTMGRHEIDFRRLMSSYDGFPPDGMPLVWCLNRAGAQLRDRVYGPTFMRQFLAAAPAESSHYLVGGSEICGTRLRQTFEKQNPGLRFVGAFHGKCDSHGQLEKGQNVIDEINRLSPDFIWVGLGTPKQQAWVERYKPSIRRGVILTVGFAFDVNAGLKPDAPLWMQRCGLTWVYRFWSEPRRLGSRYFKYNALFLFYLVSDGLRGRAWGKVVTAPEAIWQQAR
jgi:N-acetylglucosaminyldiphosphoundecaprenol N-acetyl-beta-D-mannosaminyltransferase